MTNQTRPQLEAWRKQLIWAHNTAMRDAPSKVLADGKWPSFKAWLGDKVGLEKML
jgi:hypothetical protein